MSFESKFSIHLLYFESFYRSNTNIFVIPLIILPCEIDIDFPVNMKSIISECTTQLFCLQYINQFCKCFPLVYCKIDVSNEMFYWFIFIRITITNN